MLLLSLLSTCALVRIPRVPASIYPFCAILHRLARSNSFHVSLVEKASWQYASTLLCCTHGCGGEYLAG